MNIKSYTELVSLKTFKERFEYLIIRSKIGIDTFGPDRYINQLFYNSREWKRIRDKAIIRDNGLDLGIDGYPINKIVVHHINPITLDDIENSSSLVYSLDNLICCSFDTHNAIHYGDIKYINSLELVERKPHDTCPWMI